MTLKDRRPSSRGHERFEHMAAAYVLDALEADEELFFTAHLRQCARCRVDVAAFSGVASALGDAVADATPPRELRQKILAEALRRPMGLVRQPEHAESAAGSDAVLRRDPPSFATQPVDGVVRAIGGRLWRRTLIAAAAAVVVVGGTLGGLLATGGGIGSPPTSCTSSPSCSEVTLTSRLTHEVAATLVVSGSSVWVRPLHLAPDDTRRQIYVLWEIGLHGLPRAIGAFDVSRGAHHLVPVGSLVAPRGAATAFAVSLEPGRSVPKRPSDVVAVTKVV